MARYPWYTRVGDVLHRLTVVTLAGGSLYMLGGCFYTIVIRSRMNQEKLDQWIEEKKQLEAAKAVTPSSEH
ncbi:Cox14 protein [Saccharomycopsis crataegensis]|uniref:Cox14 protein n=1 Tax=Saccharomycopsis crataegensis TaxID=43959 RepID=A0AAV5QP36_9ASCO|nr:Cox14 protein [Saccharomycopsis crataegensis]